MHKPESVIKNGMHKIIWDFEIQIDRPISTRLINQIDKPEK